MSRYTITESVGSRVLPVHSYEDLHKHHPSAGRQPNREYGTINGEFEEIRHADGRTFIKKDFILAQDGPGPVEVPAPATGYAHFLHDTWNTVQIYDKPYGTPGAHREAQVLHMVRNSSSFREGARVEYGQALGQMGETGSPGSIHAHVEAELGQFQRYIRDIDNGTIRPGMTPPAGTDQPGRGGAGGDNIVMAGDRGTNVTALQNELGQLGYKDAQGQPLKADGDFGPNTQRAVEAFQRDHQLDVDGKVGPQTQGALDLAVKTQGVRTLQSELDSLGYKDAQGRALAVDGDFGANTRFAVEAFQRDHQLTVDGKVGPQTLGALDLALKTQGNNQSTGQGALLLSDPRNPDNALYRQALAGVQKIDADLGRPSDEHSTRLAASLVPAAKAAGLTRIDAVAISEDGSRTFAAQNTAPMKTMAEVNTATAVHTPIEQSSAAAQLGHVTRTQQAAQSQTQAQRLGTPPRPQEQPPGPLLMA